MWVRLEDQEVRKWVDAICLFDSIVETFSLGKGFDRGFFIVRDSEFPVKNNVGGDPIEN